MNPSARRVTRREFVRVSAAATLVAPLIVPGAVLGEDNASLPGDARVSGSLRVPAAVGAGRYALAVAIVDPTTGQPALHLAIDAPCVDRLYRVSEVSVEHAER